MVNPTEHEKYEVAAGIAVLTFDTTNKRVSDLMAAHNLDTLVSMLLDELSELDERVSAEGRIRINNWVDGAWLATKLQTEFGSSVDARRTDEGQFLFLVDPDA